MEIGNNKKKKRVLFCKLFLIVIMIVGSFAAIFYLVFLFGGKHREEGQTKKPADAIEQSALEYKYEYKYLERLPFLKEDVQIQLFKTSFESNLLMGAGYGEFKTVSIEEQVEESGEDTYRFYLDLDNESQTVLEGIYNMDADTYTFGFYRNKNSRVQDGETPAYQVEVPDYQEGITPQIDPDAPDGTDEMEIVDYNIPLTLYGEENLAIYFTTEQINQLHTELLQYLISQNEFRRQITLRSESLVESEESISFRCTFDTARTDKKNLTVGYLREDASFVFILE
ncbi:MAG: hypothetical protein H2212_03535 [Ruminococcus sp.]|nr:hypothetical protein [Ruminococcus sp.]